MKVENNFMNNQIHSSETKRHLSINFTRGKYDEVDGGLRNEECLEHPQFRVGKNCRTWYEAKAPMQGKFVL